MTQEKFSTIEECCEFAVQFSKLTPKKKLEQKDDVVAMHIALVKHIDEIVNRVCDRHGLKCQWDLNYGLKGALGRGGCGKITLSPELLFYGVGFLRQVILHELAHLTQPNHSNDFWRICTLYLQEENLLPCGEIVEKTVINPCSKETVRQLFLNGKPVGGDEMYEFRNHNTELGLKLRNTAKVARAKRAMREILKNTPNREELAIEVSL